MVTGQVIVTNECGRAVIPVKVTGKSVTIPRSVIVEAIAGEPFPGFSFQGGYYPRSWAIYHVENVYNARDEKTGETANLRPTLRKEIGG
jgi:hypothetical protein